MPPVPTPGSTEPQNPDDAFAAAFAALQAPAEPSAQAEPSAAPAPGGDAPAADVDAGSAGDAPASDDPSGEGAAPAAAPPAAPPAPAEPPAAAPAASTPAPAPVADPVAARMAQLEAELAALKEAKPVPAEPPAPAPAEQPIYTADEQAAIDKYRTEWPDIAQGEALARRAEYRQLVSYVFDQVRQQLEPIQQFAQRQQGRTQYDDIVELVPDYDDVRDPVLAWVETQPDYLKTAYKAVAANGTPTDVADLITRFKKETGYAAAPAPAPAAAATPTPAPAPAPRGLPPAAAAAAQTLRAVKSSRSEPAPGSDPNDFEGAFAAFAQANAK